MNGVRAKLDKDNTVSRRYACYQKERSWIACGGHPIFFPKGRKKIQSTDGQQNDTESELRVEVLKPSSIFNHFVYLTTLRNIIEGQCLWGVNYRKCGSTIALLRPLKVI